MNFPNKVIFILLLISNVCFSQNIAINTTGNAPNSKAILDIDVNTKGILLPRLTDAQRNAISAPATGLCFYNTTNNRLEYWNGTGWYYLGSTSSVATNGAGTNIGPGVAINSSGATANHSAILDVSSTTGGVLIPRMTTVNRDAIASPTTGLIIYNTTTNILNYRNASAWLTLCKTYIGNTTGATTNTAGVAINTSGLAPLTSSMLDISSTTLGLLIPRLTTTERNNILSPAQGLMLYNATTNTLNVYKSSTVSWLELSNSVTAAVPVATAATNVTKGGGMPGDGSFDSNWNASTGAASYYIYFDNNIGFLSYTSVNVLTLTHLWNGCDPGSTYYYRVTAVDACGVETGFSNIITVTIPP